MRRVLLVDDEIWVVESLKRCGVWEKNGFTVIGQAVNGAEAYDKILQLKPDIVFTDIRMPEMSGLELIAKTEELPFKPLFVVVSGYAEFAYVQKAMVSGAIGYCLKPFDLAELTNVLIKAERLLSDKKPFKEEELFELLQLEDKQREARMGEALAILGMAPAKGQAYRMAVSIGAEPVVFPGSISSAAFIYGLNQRVYLLQMREHAPVEEFRPLSLPSGVLGLGISTPFQLAGTIPAVIEEAEIAAYQFFITGIQSLHVYEPSNAEDWGATFAELEYGIRCRDFAAIGRTLDRTAGWFETKAFTIRQAYCLYNMCTAFLFCRNPEDERFLSSFHQLAGTYKDVKYMIQALKDAAVRHCELKNDEMEVDVENKTIRAIIKYVNENFYKDISVQALAQQFFMNPNYMCHLFRKEVGETFTEYLTKLRIGYACDQLKKTERPISEIAEKSGYDNYFYFSRIFKKMTGRTPTEYRNHI